jgi:hypothetical protein
LTYLYWNCKKEHRDCFDTSNILSNTENESETNRNAFQQTYLVKPPQILQPVALLMFRVEAIPMFLFTVPIQICQVKLVNLCSNCCKPLHTIFIKNMSMFPNKMVIKVLCNCGSCQSHKDSIAICFVSEALASKFLVCYLFETRLFHA